MKGGYIKKTTIWLIAALLFVTVIAAHYFWLSTDLFSEFICKGDDCNGYIKIFTHIAAVLSLYFFAVRIYHQEKQINIQIRQTNNQEKQIELQIQHRVDDRFKSAIELLGGKEISVRVGGVYALYYLAVEEEKYRKNITNILCSHIRSRSQEKEYKEVYAESPSNEVQITIDLLFKKKGLYQEYYEEILSNPDLKQSYLVGVNFKETNCKYVDFEEAVLDKANFEYSNCKYCNFEGCSCIGTVFSHAKLQESILNKADFSDAEFSFANLNSTSTLNTIFLKAKFWDTQFKDVHCSLDARFSEGVMVNVTSTIEEKAYDSKLKNIYSMCPNGDYIINPH